MIEAGLFVAIGLLATLIKMNWKWRMRMLSNPVKMDIALFIFLIAIHGGTFSGGMAATIGALACSAVLSAGRWLYGYIENGNYVVGVFNISHKL